MEHFYEETNKLNTFSTNSLDALFLNASIIEHNFYYTVHEHLSVFRMFSYHSLMGI